MESLNFSKGAVKSGTKNVSEAYAQITLTSTYNHFKLNNKALAALDVVKGDTVVMFDMKPQGASDQTDRYYICKGWKTKEGVEGAKIGANNSYSYSGIYTTMLANDIENDSIAPEDLVKTGLMVSLEGTNGPRYISTKIGTFKMEEYNDGEPVEVADGVSQVVYVVQLVSFRDHTPRVEEANAAE